MHQACTAQHGIEKIAPTLCKSTTLPKSHHCTTGQDSLQHCPVGQHRLIDGCGEHHVVPQVIIAQVGQHRLHHVVHQVIAQPAEISILYCSLHRSVWKQEQNLRIDHIILLLYIHNTHQHDTYTIHTQYTSTELLKHILCTIVSSNVCVQLFWVQYSRNFK